MRTRNNIPLKFHRIGAFSLVELLVVTGIIGVLAALIIPTVSSVTTRRKVMTARLEMSEVVEAVHTYRATYNDRFPVSTGAQFTTLAGLPAGTRDFTFGTIATASQNTLSNRFNQPLPLINNTVESPGGLTPFDYQANNSEVMSILLDEQNFHTAGGGATVNSQHAFNPNKRRFFSPAYMPGVGLPGIGDDLVYRDPWGNPYLITLDLNGDGKCTDALYRMAHVTEPVAPNNNSGDGLAGLVRIAPQPPQTFLTPPAVHPGDRHVYYVKTSVIAWSFGPDGKANYNFNNSPQQKADSGDNKDNVLSWK